jgi:hypothetical protein
MADGNEIRVQDEQGNIHVFPAESTPEMIAQVMNVKPPAPEGLGMAGQSLTSAGAVPNARLRNLPNPAAGETSALGALYHGAKTGATLASIPSAASLTIPSAARLLAGGAVGSAVGSQIAKQAGAGELGQEFGGDVGGLAGGTLTEGGYGIAKAKLDRFQTLFRSLPKQTQNDLLGVISERLPKALRVMEAIESINKGLTPTPSAEVPAGQPINPSTFSWGPGNAPVTPTAQPGQAGSIAQSIARPPQGPVPSNFPTAASRAASEAAFNRNFPAENMPERLSPAEKELWQQRVFGQEPVGDIGSKVRSANPEPTRAEVKAAQFSPRNVQQAAEESLGVKKPVPGVPLKNQAAAQAGKEAAANLPQGFTEAVNAKGEASSALKGFKYDPSKREFEAITPQGQHYVYGDVSPEDYVAFRNAESKGKAWMQIRNNPLVAKVISGKRVPVKPVASAVEDLTQLLQDSLDQVNKKTGNK